MPRKFLMLSRAIRMFHVALVAHAGRYARFTYSFGQSAFFIHHMRNPDENSITDIYDEYVQPERAAVQKRIAKWQKSLMAWKLCAVS